MNTETTLAACPRCLKLNRIRLDGGRQPVCGNCKADIPIHGAVSDVTEQGMRVLVEKSPLPVIVDFWASWCGPCVAFKPVYEQASLQMAGKVVFAKLNTETQPGAAQQNMIKGIPTVVLYKNGKEAARQSGAMPLEHFVHWLSQNT